MKFVVTRFGYAVVVILLASIGTFIGLHGSPAASSAACSMWLRRPIP